VNGRDSATRELDAIRKAGLYRSLRNVSTPQEAEFVLDGRTVINFSSNNSLGLANHPEICSAVKDAVDEFGVGAGASRLVSGNMEPHEALEREIAEFLKRERALFFPSGFQANTGTIPVLAGPDTLVLSDELNHASLIDGIRLSGAQRSIYPHNDVSAIEGLLREATADTPVLVVTESLFSMKGDRAPLREITALKDIRPFTLYVDEAHSMGTLGPSGRGLVAECGCESGVDVVLGTLGKAFGIAGAFVASSAPIVELLINRARSFIFSTAPMPATAEAARAALCIVRDATKLRQRLGENIDAFRRLVGEVLDEAPGGIDHIVPVPCPGADRVMKVCADLLEQGIYCQGIRPPTVAPGKCLLRFSISAIHTDRHLRAATEAFDVAMSRDDGSGA